MARAAWILLVVVASVSVGGGRVGAEPSRQAGLADGFEVAAEDWPWWRGPSRDGVAAAGQQPPLRWSDSENVIWKADVPGKGHGSPTVVGDQVLLATADHDAQTQLVLCFDRGTGRELWRTVVHEGGLSTKGNKKASQASSSVACDGKYLFINFLNSDAVTTTALDRQGKIVWQTKITDYTVHQGYGSSPALYGPLVIVTADNKGGGRLTALERTTGKLVWTVARPKTPNYASPILASIGGRDQLLLTGCDLVASFDPLTGNRLWQIEGSTTECVTSTVTDGERIFTSGGYPRNHVSAVRADGSGKIDWENGTRVYVPSMVHKEGCLYAVTDAGVAVCWRSATGEEMWKQRLGGTFSSSPVLVGERLYATNEAGKTFVFTADPAGTEVLAENQLGDTVFATPTICGGRIYHRVAHQANGPWREVLYCLGRQD